MPVNDVIEGNNDSEKNHPEMMKTSNFVRRINRDESEKSSQMGTIIHDNRDSDLKLLNYYKGLINNSRESLENFNTMISDKCGEQALPNSLRIRQISSNSQSTMIDEPTKSKTPTLSSYPEFLHDSGVSNSDLSPLVFVDSPVRNYAQAKTFSVIEPSSPIDPFDASIDLRSINDSTGVNFAWMSEKVPVEAANGPKHQTSFDEYDSKSETHSLDQVPYMKEASMTEYETDGTVADSLEKAEKVEKAVSKSVRRKLSRPSLAMLTRSNTSAVKERTRSPSTASVNATKPKLKSVKSLPQMRRLNSSTLRKNSNAVAPQEIVSPVLKQAESTASFTASSTASFTAVSYNTTPRPSMNENSLDIKRAIPGPKHHVRYNSSSSSIDKSSVKDFSYVEMERRPSVGNSSFNNFKKNFHPLANRHVKSYSNSTAETSMTVIPKEEEDVIISPVPVIGASDFFLPKLNTSSSTSNVIGKLKSGIKKLSSPVSPKNNGFFNSQSIDEHFVQSSNIGEKPAVFTIGADFEPPVMSPSESGFKERARSLVKKASSSNLYRSKSAKSRSKSNTVTSTTTDDSTISRNIVTTAKQPENELAIDSDEKNSDLSASPPLMSPVIKVNALNSRFSEHHFSLLLDDNVEPPVADIEEDDHSEPLPPLTSFKAKEALKDSLVQELKITIQQMEAEDKAFETTQQRLTESGWYSISNINDIKKRRELVNKKWNEKLAKIQANLDRIEKQEKEAQVDRGTPSIDKFVFA